MSGPRMSRSWPVAGLAVVICAVQIGFAFLAPLAGCGAGLALYSAVGIVVVVICGLLPIWLRAGATPNRRFGLAGVLATLASVLWYVGLEVADVSVLCGA